MPTVHQLIRQVPCPACGAGSGKKCFREDREGTQRRYHDERLIAYQATLVSLVKEQVTSLFRKCC